MSKQEKTMKKMLPKGTVLKQEKTIKTVLPKSTLSKQEKTNRPMLPIMPLSKQAKTKSVVLPKKGLSKQEKTIVKMLPIKFLSKPLIRGITMKDRQAVERTRIAPERRWRQAKQDAARKHFNAAEASVQGTLILLDAGIDVMHLVELDPAHRNHPKRLDFKGNL